MFSRKVILRLLICIGFGLFQFPEQENLLYDLRLRLLSRIKQPKPSSVLLLDLSREEFDDLKHRWAVPKPQIPDPLDLDRFGLWREKFETLRNQFFWDDRVYEGILDRVLQEAPAKFLISFFYSENLVLLPNDSPLLRLSRNPSVLWASQFDLDGRLLKPAPVLTGTENFGFTNLQPDPDGVIRRAHLVYRNHISLPYRALLGGLDTLKKNLPLTEPFLIRFVGPPRFFPACRVIDLITLPPEGNPCGSLKDRFVILSPSENSMPGSNLYRTPVGLMSRGEILANILVTTQNESAYFTLGPFSQFILICLHTFVLAFVILNFGIRNQIIIGLGLALFEWTFSLVALQRLSLHMPIIPFFSSFIAASIIFLWLKYSNQETKRWQAEKKALYLRELDELKSNFISLMSHDLKTPIAKVQALTERLGREARSLSEEQRGLLLSIQSSNEELAQYIHSILNFQRIESQQLEPHKTSADINLVIEEVIQRLAPLAEEKNISIQSELDPMFPFEFDEQQIKQVLTNILDNAIKYNQAGTIVKVRTTDKAEYAEVSVEDNGSGIDRQQMPILFKKFSRSSKNTAERVKGTGLGLYLAKYFIELHGGKISADSQIGKGTVVRFELPFKS